MKKIANLALITVIAVSGFFVQTLNAQSKNGISGFVFNESRQPIPDIHVELLDDLEITKGRTKTNGSGLYHFRNLDPGRYSIKVLPYAADYEEQIRSVSLVVVSSMPGSGAVNEQVDFYLKAKKNINEGPLAAPGVIFAQEIPINAKKLYDAGIEDLFNKKENEGFDKLKKALEVFPDYFLALDRLGREYIVRGYHQAAYVLFTKAVEVNPRSFSSTFGLGLASYRLQQVDQAIKNFRRATEIDNKQVNAFLWLGISYLQDKNYSQAETSLNKANKLSDEKSADVYWQLARLYKDQNRFNESANALELYLKYKPDAAETEKVKETIKILRQKAKST